MAMLNYTTAAHRVRMTPKLLKWCTSYAPRRDGVKLNFGKDGTIDEADLLEFDKHLRADWGGKYVPAGVQRELRREALGRCAMCPQTAPLDGAHVHRRGHEAPHYFQHPHNLLLMCKNCHGRYDSLKDPSITHDVVRHRKEVLQSGLLEAIDREIRAVEEVEKVIAPVRASLAALGGASFWSGEAGATTFEQINAVSGSLGAPSVAPGGVSQLQALSRALTTQYPLAAAKVASLVNGAGTDAETWDHLEEGPPDPGYCSRGDGSPALVSEAICPICEVDDFSFSNEEPARVDVEGDQLVAYFVDEMEELYTPSCRQCGHSPLSFEFESLCGYCSHMLSKHMDE